MVLAKPHQHFLSFNFEFQVGQLRSILSGELGRDLTVDLDLIKVRWAVGWGDLQHGIRSESHTIYGVDKSILRILVAGLGIDDFELSLCHTGFRLDHFNLGLHADFVLDLGLV